MPVSKKSKKHRSEDNWSLLQVALLVLDEWVDMDSVRQYPIGDQYHLNFVSGLNNGALRSCIFSINEIQRKAC